MHFNPYGGSAAELAAALVNMARDFSAEQVMGLLRAHQMVVTTPLTTAQTRAIGGWALRLAPVFGEPDAQRQVDVVNGLLRDSTSRPYVSTHDGKSPHLHFAGERDDIVVRIQAFTAAGVAHVLCLDSTRLGRCAGEGCAVVYVDTSRNGRRRFCSTRCATRVHVAEHRRRRTV